MLIAIISMPAVISDALQAAPGREYPAGFVDELREIDSIVGRMLLDFLQPLGEDQR